MSYIQQEADLVRENLELKADNERLRAALTRVIRIVETTAEAITTEEWHDLSEARAALASPAPADTAPGVCVWTEGDDGEWNKGCGSSVSFEISGPAESGYKYCHACGKPVLVKASEADPDCDAATGCADDHSALGQAIADLGPRANEIIDEIMREATPGTDWRKLAMEWAEARELYEARRAEIALRNAVRREREREKGPDNDNAS